MLLEAVRAAHRGEVLISPAMTVRLLQHHSATTAATPPIEPAVPLTDREEEVLRATAEGLSNLEIAQTLFISLGTVKSHLSTLQDKIGARNRVELAAFAWHSGRMRS